MNRALGLIEVIGYPPAIEAADAALKAANISLGGITKVGSGIVTIQLFGDVGAIKAAVEAGGLSASRIGTVRATHVIPRVDESLINSNIFAKDNIKSTLQIKDEQENNKPQSEETLVREKVTKINDAVYDTVVIKDNIKQEESETQEESNQKGNLHEENLVNDTILNQFSLDEIKAKNTSELKKIIQSLGQPISAKKLNSAKKEDLIQYITDYMDRKKGEV